MIKISVCPFVHSKGKIHDFMIFDFRLDECFFFLFLVNMHDKGGMGRGYDLIPRYLSPSSIVCNILLTISVVIIGCAAEIFTSVRPGY